MRRDSEPCHSGEQTQCSTKFIQSSISTQQLEGQGNLACDSNTLLGPGYSIPKTHLWSSVYQINYWISQSLEETQLLHLFQSHSYLSINFTRHFFSCLKCLKIGIPDAEEV